MNVLGEVKSMEKMKRLEEMRTTNVSKMRINPYKMEMKMNFQLNVGMKPVEKKKYIHTNFLRWSALIG